MIFWGLRDSELWSTSKDKTLKDIYLLIFCVLQYAVAEPKVSFSKKKIYIYIYIYIYIFLF